MAETTVTVGTATGLHARPAGILAAAAGKAGVPVTIALAGGTPVNAASILSVISLGVKGGDSITVVADGPGADEIVKSLSELIASDLDAS